MPGNETGGDGAQGDHLCPACAAGQHIDIVGEFDDDNEPIQTQVDTCACWACYCTAPTAPIGGLR